MDKTTTRVIWIKLKRTRGTRVQLYKVVQVKTRLGNLAHSITVQVKHQQQLKVHLPVDNKYTQNFLVYSKYY